MNSAVCAETAPITAVTAGAFLWMRKRWSVLKTKKDNDKAKVTFAERIISQIDKYQSKIGNAKKELMTLLDKRKSGNVTAADEEKIIELDTFLEKTYDNTFVVPKEMKTMSNLDRLNTLINQVDELLKKLD